MPYTIEEKKRALTRVRRIKGQVEALERALEQRAECSPVLQQLAAIRGAVNSLMSDVLESHLRHELATRRSKTHPHTGVDTAIALVRTYLK